MRRTVGAHIFRAGRGPRCPSRRRDGHADRHARGALAGPARGRGTAMSWGTLSSLCRAYLASRSDDRALSSIGAPSRGTEDIDLATLTAAVRDSSCSRAWAHLWLRLEPELVALFRRRYRSAGQETVDLESTIALALLRAIRSAPAEVSRAVLVELVARELRRDPLRLRRRWLAFGDPPAHGATDDLSSRLAVRRQVARLVPDERDLLLSQIVWGETLTSIASRQGRSRRDLGRRLERVTRALARRLSPPDLESSGPFFTGCLEAAGGERR